MSFKKPIRHMRELSPLKLPYL